MPGSRFQEKIISKIDNLDSQNMQLCIQHLAKERGFLENIFNTIKEAILVIDGDLRIQYHNAAAKEMLGLPDELSRLTVSKILKGVDWETILPRTRSGDNSAKALRQELELFYPVHRIVQFYAVPHEADPNLFTLILNDITATLEKAASTAETERSQMVSMLAAGVAHEIGNPLNSLYLHLQFLQRSMQCDEPDKQEILSELGESRGEVERLDSIIHQFLHAIRPGKPDLQPLDLKELILESLNFMRHEIAARKVEMSFFWGEDVPRIMGDAGQLKQAFYNLVKNAIQSMSIGGKLVIRCNNSDTDFVRLEVSDNGKGIRKEDLAKIFTPYFTTKGSGTGLGLMIVDRIVREHGASLSVDSREGVGTTFTISFPRQDRRVKVLPPAPAVKPPELKEGIH